MKIRAFISVDIPADIKKEIQKIQKEIPEFKGKLTEAKNLHLTLKFLGEIDDKIITDVREKLKEIKFTSFETKISEIGVFSPKYVRIVWLKLENFDKLQQEIDKKISSIFKKEERFMSHLTIARVKKLKNKNLFLKQLEKVKIPKNLRFYIRSFKLQKSNLTSRGPFYETIEKYNLI